MISRADCPLGETRHGHLQMRQVCPWLAELRCFFCTILSFRSPPPSSGSTRLACGSFYRRRHSLSPVRFELNDLHSTESGSPSIKRSTPDVTYAKVLDTDGVVSLVGGIIKTTKATLKKKGAAIAQRKQPASPSPDQALGGSDKSIDNPVGSRIGARREIQARRSGSGNACFFMNMCR